MCPMLAQSHPPRCLGSRKGGKQQRDSISTGDCVKGVSVRDGPAHTPCTADGEREQAEFQKTTYFCSCGNSPSPLEVLLSPHQPGSPHSPSWSAGPSGGVTGADPGPSHPCCSAAPASWKTKHGHVSSPPARDKGYLPRQSRGVRLPVR